MKFKLVVLENRMLRRMHGPKRYEVAEIWRKLRDGKLHNLYSSPYIIRTMKPRRMRWARNVASIGEMRYV
jgi:hypothetical protein